MVHQTPLYLPRLGHLASRLVEGIICLQYVKRPNSNTKKFKNSAFTIVRPESNITVIPNKYVDELRNVSDDRLAAVEAIVEVG